ncbi:hypothetical protein LCGC14_1517670 [marine sediment metagenome]|uniref:Uncharacterized protein n=1 Tax=marine sediment metagenome TaxID=412755 RepID=A0A0F9JKE4_9ZZZZ
MKAIKNKITKKKEQEVLYLTEAPISKVEKDAKKALEILKSKENAFTQLMDKFKKENAYVRNMGCNQIIRTTIQNLNLPINMVIADLERIKFELLNINQNQINMNETKIPSYLG